MRYPILAYQPRLLDLDTALDPGWLTDLPPDRLMLPWFVGLRVVDAAGTEWTVRRAEVVRERRRWLGLRRRVDLALVTDGTARPVPLADVIEWAEEVVVADGAFWAAGEARAALLAQLRASPSHEALIHILHEAGDPST